MLCVREHHDTQHHDEDALVRVGVRVGVEVRAWIQVRREGSGSG